MSETLKLFIKSKYYSRKYQKYFRIYDELFFNYKNKKITFIEIGVANGGSLVMWKKYFGKNSRIIGVDLNTRCKIFKKKGFEILITAIREGGNYPPPRTLIIIIYICI